MSTKGDEITAGIRLVAQFVTSENAQRLESGATYIEALEAEVIEADKESRSKSQALADQARRLATEEKRGIELANENAYLRDRIHETELRLARLEGYRDRVTEFDPVSERDQYEDRLPRPRGRNDNRRDFEGAMAAEARPTWYARKGH